MDYFATLPEGCISEILSLTSAEDAVRSSAISKGFRAAADSDSVWGKFLPPDVTDIISRSVSPVEYSNKKQLYFTLCNSPILLDGGNQSFSLDKKSGKKCLMLASRQLIISWGENPKYWEWKPHLDSRFSEVASLRSICWLDIRGKIGTHMLSATTNYAAYLVFRLQENAYGLCLAHTVVRFVSWESDENAERRVNHVSLEDRRFYKDRMDRWMEVEMGSFFNKGGDDGDVEARLLEIWKLNWKRGLIVEGIQFRPV